jgi:glutamine cyclotransferase
VTDGIDGLNERAGCFFTPVKRMRRASLLPWHRAILLLAAALVLATPISSEAQPVWSYKVVNSYPHDVDAFTQGLVFAEGALYEGTGGFGRSSVRKVKLETGTILKSRNLAKEIFGEGITVYENHIIQLTWRSRIGFVYDKNTFEPVREFNYPREGWGITNDGERLIMSDGTSTLYFLDPRTFKTIGQLQVVDNTGPVSALNELEYVEGAIYANIWREDRIAVIDLYTGKVIKYVDLQGLLDPDHLTQPDACLNGIAYDPARQRLFITGKLWSKLFEITLVPPK